MTIAPIGAVGVDATKALQQLAQATGQGNAASQSNPVQSSASAPAPNAFDAAVEAPAEVSNSGGDGFVNSVFDTVYSEIDKLSSKLPDSTTAQSEVEVFKQSMAADAESLNPMLETAKPSGKDEAITALSKTFDHAIFMAMVNQVVSGVSDTSRTMIRQS